MREIELVVLDVAGTTATDDGLVVKAFTTAMEPLAPSKERLAEMIHYVNATMGQRKIDVFTVLCDGDISQANAAHDRFVEAYSNLVAEGFLAEFDGVSEFFKELRARGIGIGITTGFPRSILDFIIEDLHWGKLIDVSVAASEVAAGRPSPDMIERAMDLYNKGYGKSVSAGQVAVAGDTESDMQAGVSAGVSIIAGVLSGAGTKAQLEATGATVILDSVIELCEII